MTTPTENEAFLWACYALDTGYIINLKEDNCRANLRALLNAITRKEDLLKQCKAALYRAKCIMDAYDGTKLPEIDAALKALTDAGVK